MAVIKQIQKHDHEYYLDKGNRVLTADAFKDHEVIVPAVLVNKDTEYKRISKLRHRQLFMVPENTAAFIFNDAGIDYVCEQGLFRYLDHEEEEPSGILEWLFGSKKREEEKISALTRYIAYVNLNIIRDIKFGTRGPMIYKDVSTGLDLEFHAYGNFSLVVVDPDRFLRYFVTPGTKILSFDDASVRPQLLNDFLQSFSAAIQTLSKKYQITHVGTYSSELTHLIVNEKTYAGTWWERYGFEVGNVNIENIELSEESKIRLREYSAKAYGPAKNTPGKAKSMEDIREQVEIVNGLKALFDAGALSLEEFEMKKNEVMGFTRQ